MGGDDNGFYYITLYNESYRQPPMAKDIKEGILQGIYLLQSSKKQEGPKVKLLGSGSIIQQVLEAARMLDEQLLSNVYSVTSFGELRKRQSTAKDGICLILKVILGCRILQSA